IAVALIARVYFIEPTLVRGASLSPTLHDQDRLLISKKSEPEHFAVVVFHTSYTHSLATRVVGLPRETVGYTDYRLYIAPEPYAKPYLESNKDAITDNGPLTNTYQVEDTELGNTTVPEGQLFVMGDNRRLSKDSRQIGTIPLEDVVGVSKLIFFPFDDFQWMNGDGYQSKVANTH